MINAGEAFLATDKRAAVLLAYAYAEIVEENPDILHAVAKAIAELRQPIEDRAARDLHDAWSAGLSPSAMGSWRVI